MKCLQKTLKNLIYFYKICEFMKYFSHRKTLYGKIVYKNPINYRFYDFYSFNTLTHLTLLCVILFFILFSIKMTFKSLIIFKRKQIMLQHIYELKELKKTKRTIYILLHIIILWMRNKLKKFMYKKKSYI